MHASPDDVVFRVLIDSAPRPRSHARAKGNAFNILFFARLSISPCFFSDFFCSAERKNTKTDAFANNAEIIIRKKSFRRLLFPVPRDIVCA
jgi:hypothetical protein